MKKNVIVPELYHMTGSADNMKENRQSVTQTNQLKFEQELVAITQRVITAQFSRKDHFTKWWLFDLAKLTPIKLTKKDLGVVAAPYKPFHLKDWTIVHSEALEGVGKVLDLMCEKAKAAGGTLKMPSVQRVPAGSVSEVDEWTSLLPTSRDKCKLVGTG